MEVYFQGAYRLTAINSRIRLKLRKSGVMVLTAKTRLVSLMVAGCAAQLLLAGCRHREAVTANLPPPPPSEARPAPVPAPASVPAEPEVSAEAKPPRHAGSHYVETGIATWYTSSSRSHRAANGEVFDADGLTAAHRTLPLNTVAKVTNLKTGKSATVRITDRGPFVTGRMLDLSPAAAKRIDVYRAGTAEVRLEVVRAPVPIDQGGRWGVQIGAFSDAESARQLKLRLQRRYPNDEVLQFRGSTGYWVRIRLADTGRAHAEAISRATTTSQGAVFVIRLD